MDRGRREADLHWSTVSHPMPADPCPNSGISEVLAAGVILATRLSRRTERQTREKKKKKNKKTRRSVEIFIRRRVPRRSQSAGNRLITSVAFSSLRSVSIFPKSITYTLIPIESITIRSLQARVDFRTRKSISNEDPYGFGNSKYSKKKEEMTRNMIESARCTSEDRRDDGLCSRNCTIGSIIIVALGSLAIFVVFWCTNIFRDTILSNLEIKNGSSMFDRWQRPPVRPVYRVRIFNYTNVNDFQSGKTKKLKIMEVGPYVYRETLTRINPTFDEDDTVTYQEKRSYQWEGGNPDDEIITVPNVPLLSAMAFIRDMGFVAQVGLTAILTTMQSRTFIDVPAGGFLWGYDDKIFEMAKPLLSWQENVPFDKFGVLAFKNGVSPDRITVKTGKYDINEVGLFQKINGRKSRGVWDDERCDKIQGTDGSIFPANLFENHNSPLTTYARDMCRTLMLEYQGRGNVRGIPTLTYKPPNDTLTSTATKDSCYCARNPNDSINSPRACPPAGIFNSSVCSFGMPFMGSFPHFYSADRKLLDQFEGLNPRAEDHESVLEIHPRLGVPIGGYSRVQINLEVRKAVGVPFLGNLKDGSILPLIWVEVAIDNMPDSLQNLFYHAYFTAAAVEAGMRWISLVGIVFSICTVIRMLKRDHNERHGALKRNVSGQNPLID